MEHKQYLAVGNTLLSIINALTKTMIYNHYKYLISIYDVAKVHIAFQLKAHNN